MSKVLHYVFQDWQANQGNTKGRTVLLSYRIACLCCRNTSPLSKPVTMLYLFFYRLVVQWLMGIELPLGLNVGQNLTLHHGQALVIHHQAVIGQNCILRHSTTIGNRRYTSEPPEVGFIRIGNNVDIGANVVILGPIEIGDHAQIGAGSVVLKDVPPYSIVVGNPAKILRIKKSS